MEVPKHLMRKKYREGAIFGRIKFGSSLFASKESACTNQIYQKN